MKITDLLIAEHATFHGVLDAIEAVLPEAATAQEIGLFARLLGRVLGGHGHAEQDLIFAAFDHLLREKGQVGRLYQEHEEIDAMLLKAAETEEPETARQQLLRCIQGCRDHFQWEERDIFPLVEQAMEEGTLGELGQAFLASHRAGTGRAQPVAGGH